ncbi:hypothetical protein DFJ58DRAFT_810637 [Suillus subalutaceus]|uniref:uncharacterized protein n=1 Tax=Suillus subalutaceus TaxID=48586 RepID=UPI001B866D38|nr:uncharacterized protein DFJ58DRAFT_810637 [Suillus subalutaceus]KAG1840368.1 hypothetical protein DFJ58DRAFT_810637 [Suillus subalutaceus]
MKFTSLTTAFVTAAAMTGVVIASDVPVGPPKQGEKATPPDATQLCDKPDAFGCSKGIEGYNEGNDFAYTCASEGQFKSLVRCACKDCCHLNDDGNIPVCPEIATPPIRVADALAFASGCGPYCNRAEAAKP